MPRPDNYLSINKKEKKLILSIYLFFLPMKKFLYSILVLVIISQGFFASDQEAKKKAELTESYLKKSGIIEDHTDYNDIAIGAIEYAFNSSKHIDDAKKRQLLTLGKKHFNSELFLEELRARVSENLTLAELEEIDRFYETDAASNITRLEVNSSVTAEDINSFNVKRYNKKLKQEVDKLVQGALLMENFTENQKFTLKMIFQLINHFSPDNRKLTDGQIEMQVENALKKSAEIFENVVYSNSYLIYEKANIDDMKKYSAFYSGKTGYKLSKIYIQASIISKERCYQNFMEELAELKETRDKTTEEENEKGQ